MINTYYLKCVFFAIQREILKNQTVSDRTGGGKEQRYKGDTLTDRDEINTYHIDVYDSILYRGVNGDMDKKEGIRGHEGTCLNMAPNVTLFYVNVKKIKHDTQ